MLFLFAAAALVQAAPAAQPPIAEAAQAFKGCIEAKFSTVPATVTPEAGADALIAQCKAENDKLDTIFEGMIAAAPADQQAFAREQYKQGMAQGRQGLIDGIKSARAGKAPAK
ncbi:hypothetical protein GCM10022281_14220 [Sphingomonas rosea]|jgi:hypothetical protein|uniref:Uncharacterized protein n=1 Tax=Sphingomonas rosea TaxID=335605 RepID=A0ABP7U3H7_9SPHN